MVDELEAIRQLKARYFRFLDANDAEAWRSVFTTDIKTLHLSRTIQRISSADG